MSSLLVLKAVLWVTTGIAVGQAFVFRTPQVPWIAEISDVDIRQLSAQDLRLLSTDCFDKCPVMVFKRQPNVTAQEFLDFVCHFDPHVDTEAIRAGQVLHKFPTFEPEQPHVALRKEETDGQRQLGNQFRFGPVWHMDLVGSPTCDTPNYVSAFHFLKVPPQTANGAGNTIFANMEYAYAALPPDLRKTVDSLDCVYDNDVESLFNFRLGADGFTRLSFPDDSDPSQLNQLTRPLVQRDAQGHKRIFITPQRFHKFVGWSREESWELLTHIFHQYILHNAVSVSWDAGDIAVFCNHRLIHTSTPWELYKGQDRIFRLIFLNSKQPPQETAATAVAAVTANAGETNHVV